MSVKFELKTACSLSFESTKSLNASGDNYQVFVFILFKKSYKYTL